MASYPSAVASLGTASIGNTIEASHVNDLRREVEAIESALVNGPIALQAVTTTTITASGAVNITNSLQCDSIVDDTGLASNTYSPTITAVTNVATATLSGVAQYVRVGNIVFVSLTVSIDPTAAAPTSTNIGISLPIASTLALVSNLSGNGVSDGSSALQPGTCFGDTSNNRATYFFRATDTADLTHHILFSYRVL